MGDALRYLIYFILGGLVVTIATYFGSEKKGLIAAFFAMFPFVNAVTVYTIYSTADSQAVASYARGLILLTPAWVIYLLIIWYLIPKYNLWISLTIGVIVYMLIATMLILKY